MNIPDSIEIKESNGKGLFAKRLIKKGSIVFHFDGKIGDDAHTNPESLQIDEDKFLESTAGFDNFLNHSCEPNCNIDWENLNLVALRNIQIGEELSFDYNTAEYDLINMVENCSFKCNCGSKNCIGKVKGFRYLTLEQKKEIQKFISPFLKKKFEQE
ncbi:MAG: SET domain-containing protein [Nanoarchaeota archaeon]|nr:SET domain-containing protein [Nanoarchaeota archaeon]